MHSTGRLSCYEHRVVRSDTRSRVFAYDVRITLCRLVECMQKTTRTETVFHTVETEVFHYTGLENRM